MSELTHEVAPETDRSLKPNYGWMVPIAIALVSLIFSGYNSYNHTDKEIATRISVVETKQNDDRKQLDRIEDKVNSAVDMLYRLGRDK